MTTVMIGALTALSCFLAIRLLNAANENTALRAHVAALKRQLQRR